EAKLREHLAREADDGYLVADREDLHLSVNGAAMACIQFEHTRGLYQFEKRRGMGLAKGRLYTLGVGDFGGGVGRHRNFKDLVADPDNGIRNERRGLDGLQHITGEHGAYAGSFLETTLRAFARDVEVVHIACRTNGEEGKEVVTLGHFEHAAKSVGIVARELQAAGGVLVHAKVDIGSDRLLLVQRFKVEHA